MPTPKKIKIIEGKENYKRYEKLYQRLIIQNLFIHID